jgi:enhancing lycopene biosynthesis protein 2
MRKKIAVVLCGSGYRDGSEIRESVGILWALSQQPVEVQCFAPDAPQSDVINCLTDQPVPGETRNQLVESARIARGHVKALSELHADDFDAILLPGGFGAAKNLCDFASKGASGTVRPELAAAIQAFHNARKPIGAVCIAPAVVAIALKGKGLELTVGAHGEAAQELEKLGHKHVTKAANECHVDSRARIVTSPAYMYADAPLHEIFTGIQRAVVEVCRIAQAGSH